MFYSFPSVFSFTLLFSASCSPAGNISSTFIAYPAVSPSLYILIIYVTISPFLTVTGVLVCVYIAVVFKVFLLFINGVTSTCGSLFSSPKLSSSVPLTFVINFLNAKSNSGLTSIGLITNCSNHHHLVDLLFHNLEYLHFLVPNLYLPLDIYLNHL